MKARTYLIAWIVISSISVLCNAQDQRLARAVSISGQVLDESDRPLAGAQVNASPDALSGRVPSTVSDSQGKFTIEVYRSGRFRITASKYTDSYPSTSQRFQYPSLELVPEVIVKPDQPTPFVTVKLGPRAGTLTGQIIDDSNKQPISGATIGICRVASPRYCRREEVLSPTGQFKILVPSVPIMVEISADGYKDWYGPVGADNLLRPLTVASNTRQELSISLVWSSKADVSSIQALEAPQTLSPENGTEFRHFPRTTRLEWSQVAGARSYTVEIQYCDGLEPKECQSPREFGGIAAPPTAGIENTSYEFLFLGAQPGRWRVWANDESGKPGKKSPWSVFFYRR